MEGKNALKLKSTHERQGLGQLNTHIIIHYCELTTAMLMLMLTLTNEQQTPFGTHCFVRCTFFFATGIRTVHRCACLTMYLLVYLFIYIHVDFSDVSPRNGVNKMLMCFFWRTSAAALAKDHGKRVTSRFFESHICALPGKRKRFFRWFLDT